MITTDQFVFIHMHKTGGQSLNHIIAQCMPEHRFVGYHYPLHMLPEDQSGLPVVGIVRNPWDWYVSWYAFNTRSNSDNSLFFVLSDGGQAGFKKTVTNLVNLGSDDRSSVQYRNALEAVLPESMEDNTGVGLTKSCIRQFTDNNTGYYTWLFQRMHGDTTDENTVIGRFENLQEDFLSIMRGLSVTQTDAMQAEFDRTPRKNTSKHEHYSRHYDDELRELIAEKDRVLIEEFGYSFEDHRVDGQLVDLPKSKRHEPPGEFRKLLGKDSNFLLLNPSFDIAAIKSRLSDVPEARWGESGRENRFEVHRQTQALLLIHDDDFRHSNPTYRPLYSEFESELKPLIDFVADKFEHNGIVVRLLFAKLKAGGTIPAHIDDRYSLVNCHRIHIPIITNDQNVFMVGGEEKYLREGEVWEINNATVHAVNNNSGEDRVHLILDWAPHNTVPEQEVTGTSPKVTMVSDTAIPKFDGKRVGRNDPCPCGSGKKFKQCHGAIT